MLVTTTFKFVVVVYDYKRIYDCNKHSRLDEAEYLHLESRHSDSETLRGLVTVNVLFRSL